MIEDTFMSILDIIMFIDSVIIVTYFIVSKITDRYFSKGQGSMLLKYFKNKNDYEHFQHWLLENVNSRFVFPCDVTKIINEYLEDCGVDKND